MKKVLILLGGVSGERQVSIASGEAVYDALKGSQYEIEKFYLENDNIKELFDFLYSNKSNIIVFNALHGTIGEDGRIQGLLDLLKIPYTHSGVRTSAIAMNKIFTKNIAVTNGIKVAKDQLIELANFKLTNLTIPYPFVIKPVDEGSSVGLYLINNEAELLAAIAKISHLKTVMFEQYLKGVECTVAVMNAKALGVTELSYSGALFDYEAKYTKGKTNYYLPARVNDAISDAMKSSAQLLFQKLEARGIIRVDFIVVGEDVYFLEVNTQPGMTSLSLAPKQAEVLGINFKSLCIKLINEAKFD